MEAILTISFSVSKSGHNIWDEICEMFGSGRFGWKLQDKLDEVAKGCGDALDDLLEALPYGSESFEVFGASRDGSSVTLKLMTGPMIIEKLRIEFQKWLEICDVANIETAVFYDQDP